MAMSSALADGHCAQMTRPVVHLELHTGDLPGARAYYAGLCGWRPELITVPGGSYLGLDMGGGLDGGIVECAARRPLWLPYVEVPDVDEATERARRLGATVLLEPREGPAGWRAVVAAPAGGELAFWQPKGGAQAAGASR
jgi:predicted enzyme related to lactoylglutathione lyase